MEHVYLMFFLPSDLRSDVIKSNKAKGKWMEGENIVREFLPAEQSCDILRADKMLQIKS